MDGSWIEVQWCQGGKVRASVGLSAVGHSLRLSLTLRSWSTSWGKRSSTMTRAFETQVGAPWQFTVAKLPNPQGAGWSLGRCHGQRLPAGSRWRKRGLEVWKALRENFLVIVAVKNQMFKSWEGVFGCTLSCFCQVWSLQILRPGKFAGELLCRGAIKNSAQWRAEAKIFLMREG